MAINHEPREMKMSNVSRRDVCTLVGRTIESVTMDDSGYLHLWFNAAEDDGVQMRAHELFDEEGMLYDLSGLD